ncbi:MAG: SIS domain-containing protein [Gammaproteobacteria bacterium]|nr:SIS domain-containing protein [Gammaproteobacteria bacterium]
MTQMHTEAMQSAWVVEQQLNHNQRAIEQAAERIAQAKVVWTCARGSSDHAALFLQYLLQSECGIPAATAPPSIQSIYNRNVIQADHVMVAISQSGHSPDLIRSAQSAKHAGAFVIAMVNTIASPLAELSDLVIDLRAGLEKSVAATKSFLASLSASMQLAAAAGNVKSLEKSVEDLPNVLNEAATLDWFSQLEEAFTSCTSGLCIGRGIGLSAAEEIALKFKETSALHIEAFSSAEVQHGPMGLIKPEFPILALVQPDNSQSSSIETALALRQKGANVLIAANEPSVSNLPVPAQCDAYNALPAMVLSTYLALSKLSVSLGYNPDTPPLLNKVTQTL